MTHTLGPWMQLTGPNGRTYITDRAGPDWAAHCIAEVKEEADARLIAAAPDTKDQRDALLAALEAILPFAEAFDPFEYGSVGVPEQEIAITNAQAAVNKAKGE